MDLRTVTDRILRIDDAMRYVGFVDNKGNILYAKMNKEKVSLKTHAQEEIFAHDLAIMREMQDLLNQPMGKMTFVFLSRENLHQLIHYFDNFMLYVTLERYLDHDTVLKIADKIQSTTASWLFKTISYNT
ncbi:MAG TPA: hypothetical protein VLB45_06865 [Nitrosopumilaceae archaeon]|nr:hypothetical protein [Nitrosopumilaceae archaeon]